VPNREEFNLDGTQPKGINMEAQKTNLMAIRDGDAVVYVDEYGYERPALITAAWGDRELDLGNDKAQFPAINLAFVNPNEKMRDQYGRQIYHASSVTHRRHRGTCPGRYWFKRDEDEYANMQRVIASAAPLLTGGEIGK
jgi:hypothetical protein